MKIVALTIALSGLIVSPSFGQAGHIAPAHPILHHKPFAQMTLRGIEKYQLRLISLDRWIIQTRRAHIPEVVNYSRHRLQWTRRELRETHKHLGSYSRGHSGGVDGCLSQLIQRESGWNVHATNPVTGAYGLPQALPGSKMASAGADWRSNASTQIRWMLGYVSKYGGSCGALSFQQAHGYY